MATQHSTPSLEQLRTATRFCEYINVGNVTGIATLLSDNAFVHEYAPASLGAEATEKKDKKHTLELFEFTFRETVQRMGIRLPPKQIVHGIDNIMFLICDEGVKRNGEPYDIEYVLVFTFEAGGNKIVSIREFQDSAYVNKQFAGWYR